MVSAGGTFFGSPNNPRIVRLFSMPVEFHQRHVAVIEQQGSAGHRRYLGTLLGKHNVNIAT